MVTPLADSIRGGDRAALAKAITLVESTRSDHREQAMALLDALLPFAGGAQRIGITGVPGVGKSTLIDQLGSDLTVAGHRVAVLAVDPSSARSGGSILGDKTRMTRLGQNLNAFIRPSPAAGTLGGVARRTREAILLLEAAGFDIVVVETVGVGQSETAVASMVDCFVALMLPGAGDELQGLKKGLIEIADIIAINKADGDAWTAASRAAADYRGALNILTRTESGWRPPVVLTSGRSSQGVAELWRQIEAHRTATRATGCWDGRRRAQRVAAFREEVRYQLIAQSEGRPGFEERLRRLEGAVGEGHLTPERAAGELVSPAD